MSASPGGFLPSLDPQGQGSESKRLITTVLLITAMFVGMQMFMPQPKAPPPKAEPTAPTAPTPPEGSAPIATVDSTKDDLPEATRTFSANVAKATGADEDAVKGGYSATMTNKGGQLSSVVLDGYADPKREGKPVDLALAAHDGARFFALRSRQGSEVQLAADATYELVQETDRSVTFERLTPAGVRVTRRTTFDDKRFAFTQEVVLKNESTERRSAALDVVLVGQERKGERDDGGGFASLSAQTDRLGGACNVADSRETFTSRDIEDDPKRWSGTVKYAAIDRHYFLGAVLFEGVPTEACAAQPFTVPGADPQNEKEKTHGFDLVVAQAPIPLAPGETKTLVYQVYAGPKQLGLLEEFGHGLEENVDFGWFGAISRPMLWVLVQFHKYMGNFGIAIILLTLLMKILTFPLTQKSYVSMQQMKKIAPEIKELQKKYGHDRAILGQKQMELYQSRGINPMAGCLPLLVQMPIWFALYRTLSEAVELYQQPFYASILDLTQPDHMLPFGISLLPLIVGGLMLWQTALQPPPDDQPQMKYVLWGMPIMFTFLMLSMASGLSIYMITNSLLTMAQQYYIKRKYA